jgi:NSS family neurotransmitter:Na+ symporter
MKQRDSFTNKFGVLVAVAGSAVGLGNLWRFPYEMGRNGGAAYILVYLLFIIVICLPIMLSEFVIGRRSQANVTGAFRKLTTDKKWYVTGYIGVLVAFTIMAFYSVVGGWTLKYIYFAATNAFSGKDVAGINALYNNFISSPIEPLFWTLLFLFLAAGVVIGGVSKGIEKYSKILMPVLFLMVIILAIRSITLDGAGKGLEFLFRPDFSKLTPDSILSALGQAFFSLSLGMGCLITYASYINKSDNLFSTSLMTTVADTGFAILAGLAIMPAVFAFGIEPSAGPGLVFITIPHIFMQIPFGLFFAVVFFLVLMIAALTSAISLLEVATAYFSEEHNMSRRKAAIVSGSIIMFLGVFSSLSEGILSNITLGGKNIFEMFDFLSSNILLVVGGLLIVLFVGWKMKHSDFYDELSNGGTVRVPLFKVILFLIRYIVPVAIISILLYGLIK